ncbi:MAG TPA: hypothetical protein VKY31_01460 [Terriglobia bacterium]|nr:hypothetical protein [Terriglobia bacterium]HZP34181.1 hypothetical protein [Candidatus Acidoferrales bacterium]
MPIIKARIEGRDYCFAPLKVGQLRKFRSAELPTGDLERIDFWLPYIQDSIQRAGSTMPEFDDMDIDEASRFFTAAIAAMIEASGGKMQPTGEGQPAADIPGTTSSASS